jgi:hypothetical protein
VGVYVDDLIITGTDVAAIVKPCTQAVYRYMMCITACSLYDSVTICVT